MGTQRSRAFSRRSLLTPARSRMRASTTLIRRAAGGAYYQLFPSPEMAAWRYADQLAATAWRPPSGEAGERKWAYKP